MGWRFQKRKKIFPGVNLNFGKKSVGLSFRLGPFSFSFNNKGRKTMTTRSGIPGLYHTTQLGGDKNDSPVKGSSNPDDS